MVSEMNHTIQARPLGTKKQASSTYRNFSVFNFPKLEGTTPVKADSRNTRVLIESPQATLSPIQDGMVPRDGTRLRFLSVGVIFMVKDDVRRALTVPLEITIPGRVGGVVGSWGAIGGCWVARKFTEG